MAPRGRGWGDRTGGGTAGTATTWALRVSPAHRPRGAHPLGTRAASQGLLAGDVQGDPSEGAFLWR